MHFDQNFTECCPKGPSNTRSVFGHVMAWRQEDGKALPESKLIEMYKPYGVIEPQYVNVLFFFIMDMYLDFTSFLHVEMMPTVKILPHGMRKHDDVVKWKHFPRYWPFVRGIHRSPVNSPHKGQ